MTEEKGPRADELGGRKTATTDELESPRTPTSTADSAISLEFIEDELRAASPGISDAVEPFKHVAPNVSARGSKARAADTPSSKTRSVISDIESERVAVGWLLKCEEEGAGGDWGKTSDLTPDHFVDPLARHVFALACDIRASGGVSVTPWTVARAANGEVSLSDIVQITNNVATSVNFSTALERIRDAFRRRNIEAQAVQLSKLAGELESAARAGDSTASIIERAEHHVQAVRAGADVTADWAFRPLADFRVPSQDDADALLGRYRFLCRGGGLIIVGATGTGKSAVDFQSSVCWALGRDFLGIPCVRPLRSLILGAEDDDGDIGEVWESIAAGLELTKDEISTVRKRVLYVEERVESGDGFLRKLKRLAEGTKKSEAPFDLVRLNPLLAFAGCAVADQEEMGHFLRGGLNRVNAEKRWGYIITHHTNKPPTGQDAKSKERNWSDYAYAMSGSAEIANWARAVIIIEPLKEQGRFIIRLAKRGTRAGVTKAVEADPELGNAVARTEIVTAIYARHSRERVQLSDGRTIPAIMWLPDTPPTPETSESKKRPGPKPRFRFEDFSAGFLAACPNSERKLPHGQLYRVALTTDSSLSKSTFSDLIRDAVDRGLMIQASDGKGYHMP